MASVYPNLQVQPGSCLDFPWAEYQSPHAQGTFDAHLGPDGVGLGMVMLIRWSDLQTACQQILGYSSRIFGGAGTILNRVLPWQHPYFNQMWAKAITKVQGIRVAGKGPGVGDTFIRGGANPGAGQVAQPPWTDYQLAILTIQFWRPPYYVRSDADILVDGSPLEYLRYVDKRWSIQTQMLSRENAQFTYTPGQGLDGKLFQGSVGQKLSHLKIKRTWYQVPEAAIFSPLVDRTPNGLPLRQLYTLTQTKNPITGFIYASGSPIQGTVNSPRGGGTDDTVLSNRFLGAPMGTLLLEGVEYEPRELQLPPALMLIPVFANNEAISQLQYDVIFHFDYFDPPADSRVNQFHGHNNYPYSGNGLWYAVQSQLSWDNQPSAPSGVGGTLGHEFRTPFDYSDFTDLFLTL